MESWWFLRVVVFAGWLNDITVDGSNSFYLHPYLGKISNLTDIFQMGWNHQLVMVQKSQTTTWNVSPNPVNNAINYQPQLVNARVLNHQQYVMLTFVSTSEQGELSY